MLRLLIIFIGIFFSMHVRGQVVTTIPAFPKADQPVTITVDVSGTSLDNFPWDNSTNPVWIWTWVAEGCTSNCDAPTNVNPATAAQDAAKAMRVSVNPDRYEITFTPTTFFNKPTSELKRIGLKLKSRDWNEQKQTDVDRFIDLSDGFSLAVGSPTLFPVFIDEGEQINITAATPEPATFVVSVDGNVVYTVFDVTSLVYAHTTSEPSGEITVSATNGTDSREVTFDYVVRLAPQNEARPAGIRDGINYGADATQVTLSLWAPGKTSVYVVGDFSAWKITSMNQMKKHGEHFWITLSGLTPGTEYSFQYLIDETTRVADPYADKILDPNDQYIHPFIYPGLKPFPIGAITDHNNLDRVAIFRTGQTPYNWQVANFQKPTPKQLVIYELLIRDFFSPDNRSYQNLADTIGYFTRLGINAVQLMPVMEFNGNDSWGYNPTFMFAPDKAYGPKNKLKEFIDECHKAGIAVILDIALNHQDLPNAYALMDYDFQNNQVKPTNRWFNVTARHPYNVFFDMNHESPYAQAYIDTINHYWLNEYKVDGFRFDLSKGFTQNERCNGSASDESCFFHRDNTRIANLKRMADRIREHTPDALLILEHFAEDSEEIELSNYGYLLWGNVNHAYSQNTMGYSSDSDISRVYYKSRGWTRPHLVSYMESHDEERLMYRNKNFGSSLGDYNVRNTSTALTRMRAAGALFYTLPGPKMLWQFGESGYDFSINRCANGTISNDCRLSAKPVRWDYLQEPDRAKLFNQTADLLRLRKSYPVFTEGEVVFNGLNNLVKQVTIKSQPYTTVPQNTNEMNVHIVANFEVIQKTIDATFPHPGTWYEYNRPGEQIEVGGALTKLQLPPGRYKIFTDFPVTTTFVEDDYEIVTGAETRPIHVIEHYPNPVSDEIRIASGEQAITGVTFFNLQGQELVVPRVNEDTWSFRSFPAGLYMGKISTRYGFRVFRFIKI